MSEIATNIASVRDRISQAARKVGRDPSDITLVAVSKRMPVGLIEEAIKAGICDLGENYYQEARAKLELIESEVRWHFIGHLQTNKARYLAGRFHLIHSVDSLDLAMEIGRRAVCNNAIQDILIEVKLDSSDTKFGVDVKSAMEFADRISCIQGVHLQGLMGMAPYATLSEHSRPYFARLRQAFEQLPSAHRSVLSMGMTSDFEVAVEEGATLVRVGTGIFGARP